MRQLWLQHRQRPSLLPQLRSQALIQTPRKPKAGHLAPAALSLWLVLLVGIGALGALIQAPAALAAEVLQVRGNAGLQIGDGNRSYAVNLACIRIAPEQEREASQWLRERLPRRSRINLRPFGTQDGILLARVSLLSQERGGIQTMDLGEGLVQAGLASNQAGAAAGCPEVG